MKNSLNNKLSLTFFVILFTKLCFAQIFCGVDENYKIVKHQDVKSLSTLPLDIKVTFWNMCDDDGTNCHDYETYLNGYVSDIQEVYADYDMNINYCVKQVNNTYLNNHENWGTGNLPFTCNSYNHYFFTNVGGGYAFIGGSSGVSSGYYSVTTIHELGHQFGLPHTFANCDTNPETVNQPNCNPLGPDCENSGDGFCDTPADSQDNGGQGSDPNCPDVLVVQYINGVASLTNAGGFMDSCDDLYHDDDDILLHNYMSYSPHSTRDQFTDDQSDHMYNFVSSYGSNFLGNFDNCLSDPIQILESDDIETGFLSNVTQGIFDGLDINLNSLTIVDSKVTIKNSHLGFFGRLKLINSELVLENSILGKSNCNDHWNGIELYDDSSITIHSECDIKDIAYSAITIKGVNCSIHARDTKITSPGYAIDCTKDAIIILEENLDIIGNLRVIGDGSAGPNVPPDDCGILTSYLMLNHSKIQGQGLAQVTIESMDNLVYFDDSEIQSGSIPMTTVGGCIVANFSHFHDFALDGIYFYEPEGMYLYHNYIEGGVNSINPISYSFGANKFSCTAVSCVNTPALSINSSNNIENRIHNNIIEVPNKGIKSNGEQTSLKLICNEFTTASNYNFEWSTVSQLQGEGIGVAAGNIFSTTTDQINGISPNTIYQFYQPNANEHLNNYSNSGIDPIPVTIQAEFCVEKGPNFALPNGPTSTSFHTPYLIDDCPEGIDCTQPCPPGINCELSCPIGINCLVDCPPGIDCTQPCPPGINCFLACPEGIDCTQPLPPNELEPISYLTDPILSFLNNQYESIFINMMAIEQSLYYNNTLENLMQSNPLEWKEEVLKKKNLSPSFIKEVFQKAYLFTESEVAKILGDNPSSLFDIDISKVVFRTPSFSNQKINEIVLNRNNWLNANASSSFLEKRKLESELSIVSRYALKRLNFSIYKNANLENLWYSRLNTFAADLQIVENKFDLGKYSEMVAKINSLKQDDNLNQTQLNDLNYFEEIMIMLQHMKENNLSLFELNLEQQSILDNISNMDYRYSSTKARGILAIFFDYSFQNYEFIEEPINTITFIDEEINILTRNSNQFSIYPTISSGEFIIKSNNIERIIFNLFNVNGQLVKTKIIQSGTTNIQVNLNQGIYFYKASSKNGIINSGKIFID